MGKPQRFWQRLYPRSSMRVVAVIVACGLATNVFAQSGAFVEGPPRMLTDDGNLVMSVGTDKDVHVDLGAERVSLHQMYNNVADNAADIETNFNTLSAEISTSISQTQTDASSARDTLESTIRSELSSAATSLGGTIAGLAGNFTSVMACEAQGKTWNGQGCVATQPVIGDANTVCNVANEGKLRYDSDVASIESLQICNGRSWVRAGKPSVGHSIQSPATSCEQIRERGDFTGTGFYFIQEGNNVVSTICDGNPGSPISSEGINYGTFSDGNVTISSNRNIEQLFTNYNPRAGRYPEWDNVVITNGATLSTAPYNPASGTGGIIAFKARSVTICTTCKIDVSGKGHRGGASPGRVRAQQNQRSDNGGGPGGGRGGCGGNCNYVGAHGAGGGGGSFKTEGTIGTPDRMRQYPLLEFSAVPGGKYKYRTPYWDNDPEMGSGGGAGGLGHISTPVLAPGAGGAGGGAIQIAAMSIVNSGQMLANGAVGQRQIGSSPNPQTGSGGSGSGGLIKLITPSVRTGKLEVNGGARPANQGWPDIPPNLIVSGDRTWDNRGERWQTGGEGGAGWAIVSPIPNVTDTSRCSDAAPCHLGTASNPARSCQHLKEALGGLSDGVYFIGPNTNRGAEWYCTFAGDYASGYSWGDAGDGSVTVVGTKYIEDLFPGYDPKEGRIPQWNVVTIPSGGSLRVRPYNGHQGGILAFCARNLRILGGGNILVDNAGYRGGLEIFGKSSYGNVKTYRRGNKGEGPGGGTGGVGAKPCCHGSGGGGGSFTGLGQGGNPDFNRDGGDRSAVPGEIYTFRAPYFSPDEVMGSGGGAGGAGHPNNCNDRPFPGSPGGGTAMIMAQAYTNAGVIYARGKNGGPDRPYGNWPNGNPQSGAGGAGSGGGVKIMTESTSANMGSVNVAGGGQSQQQNWGNRNSNRGGRGGSGSVHLLRQLRV